MMTENRINATDAESNYLMEQELKRIEASRVLTIFYRPEGWFCVHCKNVATGFTQEFKATFPELYQLTQKEYRDLLQDAICELLKYNSPFVCVKTVPTK